MEILYLDMDGVLVDFESGINKLDILSYNLYSGRFDECPNIFSLMDPMPGAIEAFHKLSEKFDVYILSTPPWDNHTGWSDKLNWVKTHLGKKVEKKLILSHNKHLNIGKYLIDDRLKNGADKFTGEHIHFATEKFPDWESVLKYLLN